VGTGGSCLVQGKMRTKKEEEALFAHARIDRNCWLPIESAEEERETNMGTRSRRNEGGVQSDERVEEAL